LRESWQATERAIDKALGFVDGQMGWSRRALLPSANAVIVLAAAFDKAEFRLDPDAVQLYRRWLCLTALRGVFRGSAETAINRFLRKLHGAKGEPAKALVEELKRDEARKLRDDELNTFAQRWGPATQVMHAWLVGRKAKDWLSGHSLDALARGQGQSLPGGDLTVHHIFARRVVADIVGDLRGVNNPANYALLSQSTNAEFGYKLPEEVLKALLSEQRKIAEVQFFGDVAGDRLEPERYAELFQWRAARLAQSINDWLGMGGKPRLSS
jgi:hypothetical protein